MPPDRLLVLGAKKREGKSDQERIEKLAKYLHCSKRSVKNQLQFLNLISNSKAS